MPTLDNHVFIAGGRGAVIVSGRERSKKTLCFNMLLLVERLLQKSLHEISGGNYGVTLFCV
jgi:hypothetical protein